MKSVEVSASVERRAVDSLKVEHVRPLVDRYTLFPIRSEDAYMYFKKQEAMVWSSNEIDFTADKKSYQFVDKELTDLLDIVLAFFLPGDGLVNNNLAIRFLQECTLFEEQMMLIAQAYIECIHAETYSLMFYTLYDDEKIQDIHNTITDDEYFRAKIAFIVKWTDSDRPFPERLLAFACVEGIFFWDLFGIIYLLRSLGLFPTIVHFNELIAKDESLHKSQGIHLCKKYGGVQYERALEIVGEAVDVESSFVRKRVRASKYLNPADLLNFTCVLANLILAELGHLPHYTTSPLPSWLEEASLVQKNNFFEVRGANYTRNSLTNAVNWRKRAGREGHGTISAYDDPSAVDF